jgi:hypothetical protein
MKPTENPYFAGTLQKETNDIKPEQVGGISCARKRPMQPAKALIEFFTR